jgi:hypothetical protein
MTLMLQILNESESVFLYGKQCAKVLLPNVQSLTLRLATELFIILIRVEKHINVKINNILLVRLSE